MSTSEENSNNSKHNASNYGASNVKLNVMNWNLLADALSMNEFATKGGDVENLAWNGDRGELISQKIIGAFESMNMAIVMTQENDHPQWLLHQIKKKVSTVRMYLIDAGKNVDSDVPTKYEKFYIHRLIKAIGKDNEFPKAPKTYASFRQQYDTCNHWLKNADEKTRSDFCNKGYTCTTNSEEYVSSSGNNFGDTNDLYIPSADVGTVIFYDEAKVSIGEHYSDYDGLDFTIEGVPFTIYGSHLKSGVDLKAEQKRSKELHKVLSHAKNKLNPILLMDSNSCLQYQRDLELELVEKKDDENSEKPEWTSDVIDQYNFVNLVVDKGNECLKMRHFDTDQPKKAGQFMFDTIDKILIPKASDGASKFLPIVTEDSRAYPLEYYDDYVKLRNVPSLRTALRKTGFKQQWQADLTPVLSDMDNVFASLLDPSNNDDTLQHNIADLISKLMPNATKLPSDHPPVGATIILKRN